MSRAVPAALALVTAATLGLRTGIIHSGYWIDEAITVGIASHPLGEIPRALRLDGSPPLFYLLLHGWMAVVGSGEAATRALALVFAVLAVPASWWAGTVVGGRRAGWLAAAGAAGCPFLTYYAQETRMYSLVALLSVLACASFVLAFLRGRRRHLWLLGAELVLLLYTHNWALFLVLGMAVAWACLWRAGRVEGRDGAALAAGVALLYAPWIPSLLFQAANTGAPWAERPTPARLIGIPETFFGYTGALLLALAAVAALRRGRVPDAAPLLGLIALVGAAAAFVSSQLEPAWAARYAAVLFGPLLLALAAVLARAPRWSWAALAGVAALWLTSGPVPAKSNVRTVAGDVAPSIRAGDLVVSTQPEQIPVLNRYLPPGLRYLTPLGRVADPRMTDWRDGVARLRAGTADRVLAPWVGRLGRGRRVLLVMPVYRRRSPAPWSRAVRVRTREWRGWLRSNPRLRGIGRAPRSTWPPRHSSVRTELFEVR
jgi:mannosyltransferase